MSSHSHFFSFFSPKQSFFWINNGTFHNDPSRKINTGSRNQEQQDETNNTNRNEQSLQSEST